MKGGCTHAKSKGMHIQEGSGGSPSSEKVNERPSEHKSASAMTSVCFTELETMPK